MQLAKNIYMVASGERGTCLTHPDDCNVYLVACRESYVLIDTGSGKDPALIVNNIKAAGFELDECRRILLTHAHRAHSGGAAWLREHTGAKVMALEEAAILATGGKDGASLPQQNNGLSSFPGKFTPCPTQPLADGDVLPIGGLSFTVIATPGHCLGHCAYLINLDGVSTLFSGDTVFSGGRISIRPAWDSSIYQYAQTINRLAGLSVAALMPGHYEALTTRGKSPILAARQFFSCLSIPAKDETWPGRPSAV